MTVESIRGHRQTQDPDHQVPQQQATRRPQETAIPSRTGAVLL